MDLITEPIKLGNREAPAPTAADARITMLLWGMSGVGKTTLAATAPGEILWVLFDPDGANSLIGCPGVHVLDLSGEKHYIVERFKVDDPLGIEAMLAKEPRIETVVFDSITSFSLLATENAITHVKSATVENPGKQGYGHRGALTHRAAISMLRLTKRTGKHFIIIAHEDTPQTDDEGRTIRTTVSLSAKQANNLCMQLSEVWWMADTGKERRIAVRPCRLHDPMKSRMFDASAAPEFVWRYDALKWEGEGIATWFERWQKAGGRKLPLPK